MHKYCFCAVALVISSAGIAAVRERYSDSDVANFVKYCEITNDVDACLSGFLLPAELTGKAALIAARKKLGRQPWHGAECHGDDDGLTRCTVD